MKDRIVVITGATRGFGYSIAEQMLKAGAVVVITGRTEQSLRSALATLGSLGAVHGELLDVREEAQVYAVVERIISKLGRIDVWVNNAGYSSSAGMIVDSNPHEALDMFRTNDLGVIYCTQAVLAHMLPRREGMLVNMYGAGSFLRPATPTALYGATKAWLSSFTRSLGKELRGSGVKVLGFSPGMLLTDMLTSPRVVGEGAMQGMERYGFVLRLLAGRPRDAAVQLVRAVSSQQKDFAEVRLFKPWTPLLGMARIAWENTTRTGKTPEFELRYEPGYRFGKDSTKQD
jgi:NAD(P)-dependent dehydrogenase (short-subunit alcohol dehydrogenase family)